MNLDFKAFAGLTLRGIAMGAADVVPGVSGGTIAFISGIYEELINSLKSIDHHALKALKNNGIRGFWEHINGTFLLAVFLGIGISIISLAKALHYLLENYPELLWSFFFGLIIASAIYVGKKIDRWKIFSVIGLIVGIAIAYFITIATPAETSESLGFVFLSGAIAICAMILPGISGSFILLLMGKYAFIINSISEMNIKVLIVFILGCGTGLIAFSHLLSWLFKKYHDFTIALLTGFMIGSLNKVWPWKKTTEWGVDRHGDPLPLDQVNVLPANYEGEAYLWGCIGLGIAGLAIIFVLEAISKGKKKKV